MTKELNTQYHRWQRIRKLSITEYVIQTWILSITDDQGAQYSVLHIWILSITDDLGFKYSVLQTWVLSITDDQGVEYSVLQIWILSIKDDLGFEYSVLQTWMLNITDDLGFENSVLQTWILSITDDLGRVPCCLGVFARQPTVLYSTLLHLRFVALLSVLSTVCIARLCQQVLERAAKS